MKSLLILCLFYGFVYGQKEEKLFWDEVKNSSDVELLKLYKKQYPHGIFEKLADIKIKRLLQNNHNDEEIEENSIPSWIKGSVEYRFFGLGNATKHFKGKHYQENLARSRARRNLQDLFDEKHLSNEKMDEYNSLIETKTYTDEKGRIYIMLYIDNVNIY
ncbi:MAG: hypothetical protein WBG69_06385 [Arcobacteraceae bacterium]